MKVEIAELPDDFDRWDELLTMIKDAFAYMDGVIDPESSAHRLTIESLAAKARTERCFVAIAQADKSLVGCIFCEPRQDCLYVGKLAVTASHQRTGLGRMLTARAEQLAHDLGLPALELQTRIELTGNQVAFGKLGFVETLRTAHPGFDRPTSLTMRKAL